jgi:hypothetical protein
VAIGNANVAEQLLVETDTSMPKFVAPSQSTSLGPGMSGVEVGISFLGCKVRSSTAFVSEGKWNQSSA